MVYWRSILQSILVLSTALPHLTQAQVVCSNRKSNECEDDSLCIKVRGVCQNVYGSGKAGQACNASLTKDSGGTDLIYAEIPGYGCGTGLVCNVMSDPNAGVEDLSLAGVCESEGCIGKKVPGNCNGNNPPSDGTCAAETERVTICHRTCSEKNPWVRITIDENAVIIIKTSVGLKTLV